MVLFSPAPCGERKRDCSDNCRYRRGFGNDAEGELHRREPRGIVGEEAQFAVYSRLRFEDYVGEAEVGVVGFEAHQIPLHTLRAEGFEVYLQVVFRYIHVERYLRSRGRFRHATVYLNEVAVVSPGSKTIVPS